MVVLDAMHQIQADQGANDLAMPLELQGGQVRIVLSGDQRQAPSLMCMTRMDDAAGGQARSSVEPMRAFPNMFGTS